MRRRTFLLTGLGAGGVLVLGWSLTPPRQRLHPHDTPLLGDGHIALNGWLAIAPDDTVSIIAPRSEMGQGIHTALAMIIAEELDCSWDAIRVVHAPIDRIYNNIAGIVDGLPIHPDAETHPMARAVRWFTAKTAREVGLMMTGGSSSVRDCWDIARDAGALARAQLIEAAAIAWNVDAATCTTANGVVQSGERSLRYGELVVRAATRTPKAVKRKTPDQFTRIGQRTPPRETADLTSGALRFGIDVQLPGMMYAAVAMPPTLGACRRGTIRTPPCSNGVCGQLCPSMDRHSAIRLA